MTSLRKEHRRLQQLSTGQQTQLTDTTKKFTQLRQDAAQYLELKEDYTDLQRDHGDRKQKLSELQNEYDAVTKTNRHLWFLFGAGVMLGGWVIGMITERFRGRRKRQGGYSYQLPR